MAYRGKAYVGPEIDLNGANCESAVQRLQPQWTMPPWLREPSQAFDRALSGERVRAIISGPVRGGKSFSLAAWIAHGLILQPEWTFMLITYSARLTERFSRRIRTLAQAAGMEMDPTHCRIEEFRNTVGGGLLASSMSGPCTGYGASVVCIDDALANREAADSPRIRDKTFDSITDDIMTRLEPGASMFLTAARWHEDDPTGRILDGQIPEADFTEYRTAALAIDGDGEERSYWPERWSVKALQRIREECGGPESRKWLSLFQAAPRPDDGAVFRGVTYCDMLPSFE